MSEHFKDLESCEINYRGLEQANRINYGLMLWEQGKWEMIYRLVFPEQAPWDRIELGPGMTCSRYQWEPLIARLKELLAAAGKTPAEGWGDGSDPRNNLATVLSGDVSPGPDDELRDQDVLDMYYRQKDGCKKHGDGHGKICLECVDEVIQYWKSRAETAELKVLTFHEQIAGAVSPASRPYEVGEVERMKDPRHAELVKAMTEAQEDGIADGSPEPSKDTDWISELERAASVGDPRTAIAEVLVKMYRPVSTEPQEKK
jgi:hypothetical protein